MRGCPAIGLALLLCACASSQEPVPMPPPVICVVGADCDAKWKRAATWLEANSSLKIKLRTPSVIQTTDPAGSERIPAFTVTKVARGDGRYEIAFNGGCAEAARCSPSIAESRARFAAFVMGEEPPPPARN